VNKRARNRLIGVTAIILIAVGAIIYGTSTGPGGGSYAKSVADVVKDQTLVGKRIQVTGPVVAASWNKKTNPMVFAISDATAGESAGTLKVSYNGGVPTTFGDGTVAIITGTLGKDGTVKADTLLTKCPTKYESAAKTASALTVDALLAEKAKVIDKPTEVSGYIVAGSVKDATAPVRFLIATKPGSAAELPIVWDKALSAEFKDGANVLIRGNLSVDGKYTATNVAISKPTSAQ
jgi:cytochrome c-type biogenesis protein CcmE